MIYHPIDLNFIYLNPNLFKVGLIHLIQEDLIHTTHMHARDDTTIWMPRRICIFYFDLFNGLKSKES